MARKEAEPRTVTAVATMVSHGILDESGGAAAAKRNKAIVDAMVKAVVDLQAKGVTDPEIIRQAQLNARDSVLAQEG